MLKIKKSLLHVGTKFYNPFALINILNILNLWWKSQVNAFRATPLVCLFLALGQLDNSDYAQCLKNDEFNNSSTLRDRRVMFEDKLERFLKWRVRSWNILWKSLADINQDGSPCWSMKIPNPSCAISWSTEKSVKDIFTSLNYFTFYIHQIRYVLHTLYKSENLWLSNELFHNPKWNSWDNFMAHFIHH